MYVFTPIRRWQVSDVYKRGGCPRREPETKALMQMPWDLEMHLKGLCHSIPPSRLEDQVAKGLWKGLVGARKENPLPWSTREHRQKEHWNNILLCRLAENRHLCLHCLLLLLPLLLLLLLLLLWKMGGTARCVESWQHLQRAEMSDLMARTKQKRRVMAAKQISGTIMKRNGRMQQKCFLLAFRGRPR